jgi:hypothetical protein
MAFSNIADRAPLRRPPLCHLFRLIPVSLSTKKIKSVQMYYLIVYNDTRLFSREDYKILHSRRFLHIIFSFFTTTFLLYFSIVHLPDLLLLKFTENSRKNTAKVDFGRSRHLTLFPALVYDMIM